MRREIAAAVSFLRRIVTARSRLQLHQIDVFVRSLTRTLQDKFIGHWYPDNPGRGNAYRCIRVNGLHGPNSELLRACQESGIRYCDLELPLELTIWVDPGEVCCRFGEQNPCYPEASFNSHPEEAADVTDEMMRHQL